MLNKAKKLSSLLLVSAVLTLGGCKETVEEKLTSGPVSEITLSDEIISLIIGGSVDQTAQLTAKTLPLTDQEINLKYESENESIATVDSKGNVTGKKAGETYIKVSSLDGTVSERCKVVVLDKISASKAKTAGKAIKQNQDAPGFNEDDTFTAGEKLYETITVDGKIHKVNDWEERYYISRSEAFLRVGGIDDEIKVEGGARETTSYYWVFYTNEYYDTYAFHVMGNTKTYMVIAQQDFIGKSRFEALCEVLKNLFTGGSRIITNQFSNFIGMNGTNSLLTMSAELAGQCENHLGIEFNTNETEFTADYDDEDDFNIPVGTPYLYNDHVSVCTTGNLVEKYHVEYSLKYELDGKQFDDSTRVKYHYEPISKADLPYPNIDEFAEVADIFDL